MGHIRRTSVLHGEIVFCQKDEQDAAAFNDNRAARNRIPLKNGAADAILGRKFLSSARDSGEFCISPAEHRICRPHWRTALPSDWIL